MTDADAPWEPPPAATETQQLTGALDRLRTTFRWKADGLDAAGLRTRICVSALTLGNLLEYLAAWTSRCTSPTARAGTRPCVA
jgi:hypothetical protein